MNTGQINPAVIITSLLAASIPLSLYTTSVFIICLCVYWVIEGVLFHQEQGLSDNLITKLKRFQRSLIAKMNLFVKNTAAVVFASLYLIYLAGCLWSSDIHSAAQELREKLPLILLPILLTGIKPFNEKEFKVILIAFVSGVFFGTLSGIYLLTTRHIADTRELSPYIHHIRFSMNICLAIFILFHLFVKDLHRRPAERILFLLLIVWFGVFLFILKSLTGILLFIAFVFYALTYLAKRLKSKVLRHAAIASLFVIPLLLLSFIYGIYTSHVNIVRPNLSLLETQTASGNDYTHDTVNFKVENGQYVGLFLCEKELKANWNKRSRLDYNGKNLQGEELRYTIIRYLNAKGYRKDSVGLSKLTPYEIVAIEKGVANPGLLQPFNLSARIEGFFIDYKRY
ncbi:MAG: hypothetical protein Q8908_14130, partial [Bacteroidota bacterium]|nr:hypothetical protein [Bacteroidota bacterium]